MKKTLFLRILIFAVFLIGLSIYFISCKKSGTSRENQSEYVLSEKALLDNSMYLPKGTIWKYASNDSSQVEFTLPKGYSFLKKDLSSGTYFVLPPDDGGGGGAGYSCTCSGTGSCKVFYNKDLGFGCLQNTCSKSCTGTATANKQAIVGVLYMENDQLSLDQMDKASLSEEGKKAFFQLPQVQAEIKKNYDFVYAHLEKPDFENIDPNNLPSNYFIGKFSLYGFEIGLLLPKDENLLKTNSTLARSAAPEAPTSCKCSGSTGGDNCKLHKDCILGYCAYSCSGCTTCTMN
jgi:hypothetical protein